MRDTSESTLLQELHLGDLRIDDLRDYVEEAGWRHIDYPSDKLLVFEGPEDDDGNPIILSLPTRKDFRDTYDRLLDAVNLLSAVEETSPSAIVEKIRSRDLDIMRLRLPIASNHSPSLEAISSIIHGWRNLIAYSACMEEETKSYFAKPLPIGKKQVENFEFGHTYRGSFGLAIEARITDQSQESQTLPLQRRVIERITRGLLLVRAAEQQRSSKVISDNFTQGLNANMCDALIEVIHGIQDTGLEYTVTWSPRWRPSSDVQHPGSIFLQKHNLSYVQEAERALKNGQDQLKPKVVDELIEGPVTIQGPIIELNSESPNQRKVTIKWKGEQKISFFLGLEDYQYVCDVYRDGKEISVDGRLKKSRKSWLLEDPHNLKTIQS